MKAWLIALAAILVALPILPGTQAQAVVLSITTTTWGNGASPGDGGPGDRAITLTASIKNNGTDTLTSLSAVFQANGNVVTLTDPTQPLASLNGSLPAGQVWLAHFTVDISDGAEIGNSYPFTLQVNGVDSVSGASVGGNMQATINVTGRADLQASTTSPALAQGSKTTLRLAVANKGTAIANALVSFASQQLLVVDPTNPTSIYLGPGDNTTVTVTVRAPDATQSANLSVLFSYTNTQGTTVQTNSSILFAVGGAAISTLRVGLTEQQLNIGRANTLHFLVTNTEAVDLASVTVTGKFSNLSGAGTLGPLNGSDVQTLPSLAAGQTAVVAMQVLVSSSATGLASFTVVATGTDPDGSVSGSYDFSVALVGTVEFSFDTAILTPDSTGTTATLTGTVTNLGNAQAHNVYLSASGPGASPLYLGDVDPNSATPYSISVRITNGSIPSGGFGGRGTRTGFPSGAPGAIGGTGGGFGNRTRGGFGRSAFNLSLQWNDDYGTIHNQDYNVSARFRPAQVQAPATSSSSKGVLGRVAGLAGSAWTWVGLAAIGGGVIYALRWRRRKAGP